MTNPKCDRCGKKLVKHDTSRPVLTLGPPLPPLYQGVVCESCGKIECTDCKGKPLQKPCSWCGGSVAPAYEHLLK